MAIEVDYYKMDRKVHELELKVKYLEKEREERRERKTKILERMCLTLMIIAIVLSITAPVIESKWQKEDTQKQILQSQTIQGNSNETSRRQHQ